MNEVELSDNEIEIIICAIQAEYLEFVGEDNKDMWVEEFALIEKLKGISNE